MEHIPTNFEQPKIPEQYVRLPEVPGKFLSLEDEDLPNISPEEWGNWLTFATSEFVLTKIWADTELKSIQLKLAQTHPRYAGAEGAVKMREDLRSSIEDSDRWYRLFGLLSTSTLTREAFAGGPEKKMDRSWWYNTVNSTANVLNNGSYNLDGKYGPGLAEVTNQQELFNFFIEISRLREWTDLKSVSYDEYRNMLHSTWKEAETLDPDVTSS